jgi:hypothetical protein
VLFHALPISLKTGRFELDSLNSWQLLLLWRAIHSILLLSLTRPHRTSNHNRQRFHKMLLRRVHYQMWAADAKV